MMTNQQFRDALDGTMQSLEAVDREAAVRVRRKEVGPSNLHAEDEQVAYVNAEAKRRGFRGWEHAFTDYVVPGPEDES